MGEFADYTLDEVIDFEEARTDYRTGKMSTEEALDRGIIDTDGSDIPQTPQRTKE